MSKLALTAALDRLNQDANYSAYTAVANALLKVKPELSDMPVLKIAVLRNFTMDPMIEVIKGEAALAGFYPLIYLGDYDSIAQDVFNPKSALYNFQPELVIVAHWLDALAPDLISRFAALTFDQLNNEIDRVLNAVSELITAMRRHTSAPILINNFPLPAQPSFGILDAQSANYQTNSIIRLNQELSVRLHQTQDVYLVDYMSLMAKIGSGQGVDLRYWQIGRAPIGRSAVVSFGQEYGKFIRALKGKARKCLVLDCDNILWGGIVGEDGLEGIAIGASYPGSCYQAFQQEILNLHDRGVIIALCSKNNEDDVLEVLRKHPEMVLREKNIAIKQINWDDKVTNLRRIAQDLNIGLDSLVFVDDSQFECDLVRQQLPQVAVLQLSLEPSTFRTKLADKAYFDTLTFSAEDRQRNQLYRDQTKRTELQLAAGSLDEYYKKLEMVAEIGRADEFSIPRIAQLSQKTNQFNLTTQRYTVGEITALVEQPQTDVFYLKLSDRVAAMGIIGVAIIKYGGAEALIDTFLISCRALGRGAEDAFLAQVLNVARKNGCHRVLGRYSVTKKNSLAADFYARHGFNLVTKNPQASDWDIRLEGRVFSGPSWIKIQEEKHEIRREKTKTSIS